jgi:hypothetical protein
MIYSVHYRSLHKSNICRFFAFSDSFRTIFGCFQTPHPLHQHKLTEIGRISLITPQNDKLHVQYKKTRQNENLTPIRGFYEQNQNP